jgi:aspartate aminotransferase
MTGWRIGYAGGSEILIKKMAEIQGQSTGNPSSVSQAAAVAALNGPQDFMKSQIKAFQERRNLVVEEINNIHGLSCTKPEGAFYIYPSCAEFIGSKTPGGKIIANDSDFAAYLIESEGVAVVPGAGFGQGPAFRISYATSAETLREACKRTKRACEKLK